MPIIFAVSPTTQFVEKVENVKQIEVRTDGRAEFEVDMQLRDPNSQVLLFKVRYSGVSHKLL